MKPPSTTLIAIRETAPQSDVALQKHAGIFDKFVYELGTDTFVIRDGKIVAQSFAGKVTPKS